ncbi:MAG: AAA family ATPase [Brumimicrobium sp.]
MRQLVEKSILKINKVSKSFKRSLYAKINRNAQLIAIKGARGTGKTTLLLQLGAEQKSKDVLYVALDDLFFSENTLYSLAEQFNRHGGKLLLLDEVHKYPNWSRELKLIYDDFSALQVIFTSSSILDIYKGESDLSRRAISYTLSELSFREYLALYEDIHITNFSFDEIITNHSEISLQLIKEFSPFKYFSSYLEYGNYPYYEGDKAEYYQKIRNTVNLILDVDIQAIENVDYNSIVKIKRLLYVLSSNVPFTPNINKLSEQIQLNRNALVRALQLLSKAELIHTLYKKTRSISTLNKPDKIWMHNTNLMYAISDNSIEIGNIRETFFLQNIAQGHSVSIPKQGDILVDHKYLFEIGGKNKSQRQIEGVENAFLVKDDIELGVLNTIPLWLFGFLY